MTVQAILFPPQGNPKFVEISNQPGQRVSDYIGDFTLRNIPNYAITIFFAETRQVDAKINLPATNVADRLGLRGFECYGTCLFVGVDDDGEDTDVPVVVAEALRLMGIG